MAFILIKMSDWSRIRKRLKDSQIDYKIERKEGAYNFIVSFGAVKMWFSQRDGLMTGLSVFDLFTNCDNKMIQYWSKRS